MRTETTIITIPVYAEVDGEFIKTDETREVTLTDIYADEGKTFIHIPTNRIAGTHITLGTNDSEENYYETDLRFYQWALNEPKNTVRKGQYYYK